jgi:hypothetical protein
MTYRKIHSAFLLFSVLILSVAQGYALSPDRLPFHIDAVKTMFEDPGATPLENLLSLSTLSEEQKEYIRLKAHEWFEEKTRLLEKTSGEARISLNLFRDSGALKAGTAKRIITPPRGCPLSGYGDRVKSIPFSYQPFLDPLYYSKIFKPSLGVHDELWVKAVVLDNGYHRIALIGVDSIGITQYIFESIASYAEDLGIPRSGIILCGSHSHSGFGDAASEILWWIATADIFDGRIFEPLKEKVFEALDEAVTNLEPARLGMGSTYDDIEISHNRRGNEGIIDTQVGVIKIEREAYDEPLAIVFNYAIHGTSLGGENLLFSGDNMGYAERYVESQIGGDAVAIFLNGAEGDVAPNGFGLEDDWQKAETAGQKLGERVLGICNDIVTDEMVVLSSAHRFADLPTPYVRPGLFEEIIPIWIVISLKGLAEQENTNFNVLRINNTVLSTVPGEPITQIGWEIKDFALQAGFDDPLVIGLGNGHIGYITTEEEYWKGGYESGATLHGPETGSLIVRNCTGLIDMLKD